MDLHIHVPWILQAAEAAGVNDPASDDYGVPVSAVARHRAESSEQPGHDGPCAKAAQPVRLTEQPAEAQAAAQAAVDAPDGTGTEADGVPLRGVGDLRG
ncbi:fic family toxin-antitoxin system, toxin component [Streptomyces hirsutus]|uniref:fic family toxin-antitoxin system, toxin component n=1 Tax=Streptomyces hirsutus TaxID=35620 RepID=UPI0033E0B516